MQTGNSAAITAINESRRTSRIVLISPRRRTFLLPLIPAPLRPRPPHGIAVDLNPIHSAVAAAALARAAREIRKANLVDLAQIDLRPPLALSRADDVLLIERPP